MGGVWGGGGRRDVEDGGTSQQPRLLNLWGGAKTAGTAAAANCITVIGSEAAGGIQVMWLSWHGAAQLYFCRKGSSPKGTMTI